MNVRISRNTRGPGLIATINVEQTNGTKIRERIRVPFASKTEAKKWGFERAAHLVQFGKEKPEAETRVPTLAEFAPRFIKEYAIADNQKPSSVQAKRSNLRVHLIPILGTKRLNEIGPAEVQHLKSTLLSEPIKRPRKDPKRSPKTVNNIVNTLTTLLGVAKDWGIIESVPKVKLLKSMQPEVDFYDFPEWERLVAAAKELDARAYLSVLLAGEAGLRVGEIVALEWGDIDFTRGVLRISRSEREGDVTSPKGGRAREVDLTARLAEALRSNRHLRGERVLWRDDGHPKVERPLIVKWLERSQRKAGLVKALAIHKLRHTFCSHLAMRGAPLMAIKELAGHQQITTTMRYMHLSPSAKRDAIKLLEKATSEPQSSKNSCSEGKAEESRQVQ